MQMIPYLVPVVVLTIHAARCQRRAKQLKNSEMHKNENEMKAWELTRDLLRDTKPVVRTAEEQTWDASAVMKAQDDLMAMPWKSNVPGSAAPECLMAGALQSLEKSCFVLAPYEELLRDGLTALERGDFVPLVSHRHAPACPGCARHGLIRTIRRKTVRYDRGTN